MNKTALISSWSGGKDSCLACYKAMQHGYEVKYLLNFVSKEYKRCCFHGIPRDLLKFQAELVGIPLVQKEVTADMQEYEKEFKQAVLELKTQGIEKMVFGDIYLDEHKDWVERVCKDVGVEPLEPLWDNKPQDIIKEFVESGFKSIVVSAQADKFDSDFIGRLIDNDFGKELVSRNICPCGENGEFHTFVVDGPLFKRGIKIQESEVILKEGFWKYWFMDIKKYE